MGGHIQLKPSWSFPNVNSLNRVYAQRGELRVRQYIERATEERRHDDERDGPG